MPVGDWRGDLRRSLEANESRLTASGALNLDAAEAVIEPLIEAAYKRGQMAGRSQSGYATRRKSRKEE